MDENEKNENEKNENEKNENEKNENEKNENEKNENEKNLRGNLFTVMGLAVNICFAGQIIQKADNNRRSEG